MPTADLPAARAAFAAYIAAAPKDARVVCLHDSDADGIAAGVIWQQGLERLGYARPQRVIPDRDRNAWTPANRDRVAAASPERLFVLDLGSRAQPVVPAVATCFVDHHRPEGVPPEGVLISSYGWDPSPNTSLLVWQLLEPLADVSDLDWIAAIGTISDLGERAPFAELAAARARYTARWLKEATALVNAVRRASSYEPEVAAQALLAHAGPRELVQSTSTEVERMREARAEVKAALDEAKRAAPVFAGRVALVRVRSACQVHPLMAQIWRSRLPNYVVFAANEGYQPERVAFSARAPGGTDLLALLAGTGIDEGDANFGHGHDQASGGSLPVDRWNALLAKLGFPPTTAAGTA